MDGDKSIETGASSSNSFYNSDEDDCCLDTAGARSLKKIEECDYIFPDINIYEGVSNPTCSKSSNSNNSKEDVRIKKSQKIIVVGNDKSEDMIVRNIYITYLRYLSNDQLENVSATTFEKAVQEIVSGKLKIRETAQGLIVSFNKEEDYERVIKLNMSKIFNSPIVIWNIPRNLLKYNKTVLIRDIPWCVPISEVKALLEYQGIHPLYITRLEGSSIRIEVKSAFSLEKLLKEGLNFYNCVTLPAVLESGEDADIIQCYKCQRFWHFAVHCPYHARCVRCGEKHEVWECLRSRQNAVCCLCGESHHAACKLCPIRTQHLNSMQIDFAFSREPSKHHT